MSETLKLEPKKTKKQSFEKVVRNSCLKNRISPTTIETLIAQPDKNKVFQSLVNQLCFVTILPSLEVKEQTKIFKDLIKISEAI